MKVTMLNWLKSSQFIWVTLFDGQNIAESSMYTRNMSSYDYKFSLVFGCIEKIILTPLYSGP